MQTIHIIVLIGGVWLLLGLFFWALIHGGRDAQDDLDDEVQGYVDQDHDGHAAINTVTEFPGRDAWKHASVKAPHADASAATFHRAGDA